MAKSILVTVTNDLNQDQRMHRICKSLVEEGFKVCLVGREKSNSNQLLNHSFDQQRLKCFFSKGFLFYLEYNIRIFILALKIRPDVIYAVDLDTLMGGGTAAILLKSKLIHDAHEYFVEVPELEGKWFKKRIWNFVGSTFIPKCDLCFSVNQELAEILSDKYKNKFHVVRSVPYLTSGQETTSTPNEIPVILYQGVLNQGRGLPESILAVGAMETSVVLRIAGEGDLSEELRTLAKENDTKNRVQFLGWLTPAELKKETMNADVGLNLLSSNSLNYKYSLANKFFDYMHAGVPSINMNFPVYRRICQAYEVGICIDNLDKASIQYALHTLLNNPDKMQQMKNACALAKEVYNWDNESKTMLALVSETLSG